MDEKRSWIKSRKKRLRILAAALACCLLFTTYPDILATLPVLAEGKQDGDGTVYVTGFEELPEEVREQTVPLGTEIEELTLPDTLEAVVTVTVEEEASEESAPEEEGSDDTDRKEEDGTATEDGTVTEDGTATDGETGTEGTDGETGTEGTDGETGTEGTDDETGTEGTDGETGTEGTDGETGTEGTDGETGTEGTDGGTDTEENNDAGTEEGGAAEPPAEETDNADNTEAEQEESAPEESGTEETNGESAPQARAKPAAFSQETHTVTLPVYAAGNELTIETMEPSPAGESDSTDVPAVGGSTDNSTDNSTGDAPAATDNTDEVPAADSADEPAATDSTGDDPAADSTDDPQDSRTEQTEPATIENIIWESDPAYDAQTEGVYVFTPVLPEGYAPAEGVSLPEIRVEVKMTGQTLTPEQYARMIAGLQDDPELLTEEDVLEAAPELAPQTYGLMRAAGRAAKVVHPGTYFVTMDNEDNAGSGKADGDLDEYLHATSGKHPIEATIEIPAEKLPQKSCYIAVRTYDVNWQGLYVDNYFEAEYDKLFVNGVRVGTLTGLDNDWNTSYYRVPLSCLKEGKNTVRVEIYNCQNRNTFDSDNPLLGPSSRWDWAVSIDWMQLVCDGGSREGVEEFSLTLKPENSTVTSKKARIGVEMVINSSNSSATYHTEYSIMNSKGFIVGSFQEQDVKSGSHGITVTMPKGSASGTYTVQGMLKDAEGKILATDSAQFRYEEGKLIFGPKLSHILSTEFLTNQDVTVMPQVVDDAGCKGITFSPTSYTATTNGDYTFTANYTDASGNPGSTTYTAEVTNIDKTPPAITYNNPAEISAEVEETAEGQLEKAWTITDDVSTRENCKVTYSVGSVDCKSAEGFKKLRQAAGSTIDITVTAVDEAGNQSNNTRQVKVAPMPPEISVPTANQEDKTKNTFTLAAEVTTAVKSVEESGFVWGVMQNPTLELNQGMKPNDLNVQTTNKIQVDATDIVDGVNYYCRAYVKADGVTYYSEQKGFDIGAKKYGEFTISHSSDGTFTVTRSGGTDGVQTVYYRTVNGSAVSGTHFEHKAGTLIFAQGVTSLDIEITEKGVTTAYKNPSTNKSYSTTSYSNAARTYQVEIYRVDGGATLGSTKRATRTMPIGSDYKVDSSIYEQTIAVQGEKTRGDTDSDHLGWTNGKAETTAIETVDIAGELSFRDYWLNTANSQDSLYYRLTFDACEVEDGYQAIQITPGSSLDTKRYPEGGALKGKSLDESTSYYMALFEHGGSKKNTAYTYYEFPNPSGYTKQDGKSGRIIDDKYVKFNLTQESMCVGYGGSGSGSDKWKTRNVVHHFQIKDTREPQFLGMAPMVSTTYKVGDEVIVSLIFDEVVGSASNVSLNTSWGTFSYAGGVGTNVLYFKRIMDSGASGELKITGISGQGNIKDMCNNASGSVSVSGTLSGSVDTTTPTVSITDTSLTNGTAKGTVNGTNVNTLKYAWTKSSTMPVTGWVTCTNGTVAATRQTSGKWYLHVLGTYSGTGANAWDCKMFDFGSSTNPISPLALLAVSVNNMQWATQRPITITKTPVDASLQVKTPSGQVEDVSGTPYTAQENGSYIFTMTVGDETMQRMIVVSRLDHTDPTLTLKDAGKAKDDDDNDILYHILRMTATAADSESGIQSVKYCFSEDANAPAEDSGSWQTAEATADGVYVFEKTAASTTIETWYLHVMATDKVGNVTQPTSSPAYKLVKGQTVAVTLTETSGWTKGNSELTWKITDAGAGNCTVSNGGGKPLATGQDKGDSGTFEVGKNGIYSISVTDQHGNTGSAFGVVNNIDKEAPEFSVSVKPDGFAQEKTLTLSGVTDNLTPQYNLKGGAGNSGSGVAKQEYQAPGESEWKTFTGNSFTVTKNGTYQVKLTDKVGNESVQDVEVSKIDTTPPEVNCEVNATINNGWYKAQNLNITLTYSDNEGVTKLYAKKDSGAFTTLTDISTAKGTSFTKAYACTEGVHIYTFKAEDAAGNSTQTFITVKWDQTKPQIGNITCDSTVANLPDWMIRKDKLTVSIPVSDSTSGVSTSGLKTLTYKEITYTKDGTTAGETTKTVSLSENQQKVTLTLNADWKGRIWDIKCTDMAGNTSETTKSIKGAGNGIIVEDNAPVVKITPPATVNNGWYNKDIKIGVSVTDDKDINGAGMISGGIAGITWKEGPNGTENTVEGLPGTAPVSVKGFDIPVNTDGTHTYYVKAVDNAGNESELKSVTVKVDRTKPQIGEITCEPKAENILGWIIRKDTLTVSIPVSDSTSGLKTLTYKETTLTNDGTKTNETTKEVDLSGKEQTVTLTFPVDWKGKISDIKCTDMAGNISDTKSIAGNGIIVEDNAPVVTITPPATANDDDWYNEDIDIGVSVTDNNKGSDGKEMISGGIAGITWKEGTNGAEKTVDGLPGTAPVSVKGFDIPVNTDGTHTYYVKAADNAGNVSTGNENEWQTVTVKMDQTKPAVDLTKITVENVKTNPWNWIIGKTGMIIKIPCSCIKETLSGIEEVFYTATPDGGGEKKSETIVAKNGTYEIPLDKEFSGTIQLTVKDNADNITQVILPEENKKVIAENNAPVVKIAPVEKANKNDWYNKDIDIAVSVTDNKDINGKGMISSGIAEIKWKEGESGTGQTIEGLPGTNAPVCEKGFIISAKSDGTHTYYVKAVDNAGNKSTGNDSGWQTVTVNVDQTKPAIGEITCEQKAANLFNWMIGKESLIVNIPVSDSISGVETLTYKETLFTENGETKSTGEKEVTVSENQQKVTLTFPADWKGKITDIRCTDRAGNTSDAKNITGAENGIIVENNAPVVTITPPKANDNDWYNEDIDIAVSVTDNEDSGGAGIISGGIAKIIWKEGESGTEKTIEGLPGTNALVPETEFTISEDEDGKHTYYVKAVDNAGNDSGWQTVTAQVDKTRPAVDLNDMTVENGKKNLWDWITGKTSMIIKIPGSCITDTLSGIEEVSYTATTDGSDEEKSEIIHAENGIYEIALKEKFSGTIKLTVKDKADNNTQVTLPAENGKVIEEDYAPVIKITKPDSNENGWYNKVIDIAVAVTDSKGSDDTAVTSGGIAEIIWKEGENGEEQTVELTVEGLPVTDAPVYEEEFTISVDTDGTHTYYVKAVDNAGNDSGWQMVTAKVDTEKPKIGEITCEQKAVNIFDWIIGKDSMLITVPLTDNGQDGKPGSGVETVDYTLITADTGTDSDVDSPNSGADSPGSGVDIPGSGVDIPGSGVETVEYTLTTADTGTDSDTDSPDSDVDSPGSDVDSPGSTEVVATGAAVVREAEDGTFIAEITVLADFKGKVKVSAIDKAGNLAAEKTLGVDGSGKKGIIVEDNAPNICFSIGGGEVAQTYYDTAPAVDISVDDTGSAKEQDGTDQTKTAALITGGIASVTCTITNDSKTVTHTPDTKYKEAMKESDSFAIPANKLFFGINTITVTAVDNAGNKAEKSITVKIKKPHKHGEDDTPEGSAGGDSGIDTPEDEKSSETPEVTPPQPEEQPEKLQQKDKPEKNPEEKPQPDQGVARPAQTKEPQTVPAFLEDGKIVVLGEPVSTGSVDGMNNTSTVLKLEDGAVIVTVVCKEQKCTAGVADTVAVANAVLTQEQIQLVADGETIEILIDVKDISDKAPQQDKDVIERGIKENRKELPDLTIGMYIDISMFIKIGTDDWNAITRTEEPIDVAIGIPETLKVEGRKFTIIRSHDGEYTLLPDIDDNPDTITISTNLFSAYAIAYEQADGNAKCGLCHICPTFLGICCFIWLTVILAVLMIIVIVVWRKRKGEKEKQEE